MKDMYKVIIPTAFDSDDTITIRADRQPALNDETLRKFASHYVDAFHKLKDQYGWKVEEHPPIELHWRRKRGQPVPIRTVSLAQMMQFVDGELTLDELIGLAI